MQPVIGEDHAGCRGQGLLSQYGHPVFTRGGNLITLLARHMGGLIRDEARSLVALLLTTTSKKDRGTDYKATGEDMRENAGGQPSTWWSTASPKGDGERTEEL